MIQILLPALVAIAAARRVGNNSGPRQQLLTPGSGVLFLKFMVLMFGTAFLTGIDAAGRPAGLAVEAAAVLFCFPTLLTGPLLVRLGMPRLTYLIMRCCLPLRYAGRQHSGAMLYATLSATRMRNPSASCARLVERVRATPIKGAIGQSILAHLAAAQGDRVTAHCLFESIDLRPIPSRQSILRVTARDWLVMDAARRGDWSGAARIATRGPKTSRWSRAVGGIARTIDGVGALPKWKLRLLWLVAPRRILLRPLLQRALTASVRESESDIAPPRDLPAALARFAEVLAKLAQPRGEVSSSEFVTAVRWVTIRLENADMKAQVGQRLAALDSTLSRSADLVVSELKSDLVKLISPVLAAAPELVAAGRGLPVIADASRQLQGSAFESLEMRAKDLARRAGQKQSLDILSEWQSWALLCDEANRLLALQPAAKATLFDGVWRPLVNYAVFQHNDQQRLALAQDVFRWLLLHAGGNRQAVEVLEKNLACYKPED